MSEPVDVGEPEDCPKCGEPLTPGYGLMGGGIGVYQFCEADGCDYFHKTQDGDEDEGATPGGTGEKAQPKDTRGGGT